MDPRFYEHLIDTSRFALTIEGDNNAGGGNGEGGPAATGGGASPAAAGPDWEEFTNSLERLNGNLGGGLDALINEVRTLRPAALEPEPPNYEEMDNAALTAHILGSVTRVIEEKLGTALAPVTAAVNGLQRDFTSREVSAQIESLRSGKKDFNDWKPEIVDLAKQHTTLSVPQLYALARADNPTKAAELDKKYAPPVEPPKPRWGGLTPSGGTPGPSNGAAPEKLSGRDATLAAYREVQTKHSTVLRALEDL